jgi:hypothetical protein
MRKQVAPWCAVTLLMIAGVTSPARAQGTYVSASLTGDLLRLDSVESVGVKTSRGGEAIGFALRVGTELGPRWGVELEFARPAEIDTELSPGIVPLPVEPLFPLGGATVPGANIAFPSFSYRIRTSQRNTTLSAALWARQQLSPKVSIVYTGGAGFRRATSEVAIGFDPLPALGIPIVLPTVTTSTNYDVGPFAGIEGRIALTEHVQLVPGIRLHGVSGGWLLRPSAGIAWRF